MAAQTTKKAYGKGRGNRATAFWFLLPSCIGLLLFSVIPIGYSMLISLTDWNGLNSWSRSEGVPGIVGIGNYRDILRSDEFWQVLGHTFYFIVLYIPLILLFSVLVAVLMNQAYRGTGTLRVLLYLPVLTSWVAGALIWKWLLSPEYGPVNDILSWFGINGPAWLQSTTWAMPSIVLASVWKDMGFFGLILLGGLRGIDPTYLEAAQMDGATAWRRFTKVTLPLLSPVLFFVIMICLINSFQLFPQVMVMTKDAGPHGATEVMVERIYKYSFKYYKMGYASAFSWLLFAIIFAFTMIQNKLQKRWVHYDS